MDKFFKISERNSTIGTEIVAGITTFLAMAYILFVNPSTLEAAGMDWGAVFVATGLAAAIGTLIMGLYANLPIAQAPGMGMNAFFAYYVVLTLGYSWQQALAGIMISGIIFVILSVTGARKAIINAIPTSLKYAVGTGIGFFIAFIGFKNAGIVVANPATFVGLGDITSGNALLALIGLVITFVLYVRKVKGSIFIGMVITSIIGMFMGLVSLPAAVISAPPSLSTFGEAFGAFGSDLFTVDFLIVIFTFLFVDFFDTAGTILAVGFGAGLVSEEGELVDADKALLSDSLATVIGAVLGTSSVTSYIESLTGVEEGGKTGLTAVVTAGLFLLALFFSPLLSVVTAAVTAPALIMVGALMVQSFGHIEWDDIAVTIPSFLTVMMMVLTFSIAEGIAFGFVAYTLLMVATNRAKTVSPIMYGLTVFFILHFVL
jgi:AGZA family xanthine/uracil permease-like MFS transporter